MSSDGEFESPIVGFEFTGDPLLDGEFLPLRQGLTVLYGLNGAGKTRLLRGIGAALTGARTDVQLGLVVRMDRIDLADEWAGEAYRRRPVRVALAQAIQAIDAGVGLDHLRYEPGDAYSALSPAERPMSMVEADDVIGDYVRALAGDTDPRLTEELLATRRFLLVPTGTRKHPAWDAWPVADTGLPAAARQWAELRDAEDDFNARAPRDVDPMAPFDDPGFKKMSAEFEARFGPRALVSAHVPPRARGRGPVAPSQFAFFAVGTTQVRTMRGLELRGEIDFGVNVLNLDSDAVAATEAHLGGFTDMLRWQETLVARQDPEAATDFRESFESTLVNAAESLGKFADLIMQRAIPGAPSVRLHVRPRELLFEGPAAEWRFGAQEIGMDDLSRAERLWANRAINQAIHEYGPQPFTQALALLGIRPDRPSIAILDEPEAALHRSAEAHMAAFLVEENTDPRRCTIVATHSPDLLDAPASHTIEVRRAASSGSGKSRVQYLAPADRDDLARLGIHPSDLLRSTRAFLLVEGVHDEIALRAFLDDRLRRARVEIVRLSGAKNLKRTLESDVLYKFTSAKVVALLDNIRIAAIAPVWNAAVRIADEQGPQRGADHVFGALPKADETGALRSWLGTALSKGYHHRVAPFGLQRRDVLEYFPAGAFTSRPESWDELRAIRASEAGDPAAAEAGGLKDWVARRYGTDFSGAAVEIAVAAESPRMDPPPEFLDLMTMLESSESVS